MCSTDFLGPGLIPDAINKRKEKKEAEEIAKRTAPKAAPAPPDPKEVSSIQNMAKDRQRRRALSAQGRGSTIKTGALGLQTRAATTRKQLLGE